MKEELQAMREGLTDIIPADLLAGLTAEVRRVCVVCACAVIGSY